MTTVPKMTELNAKNTLFIEHYLQCWNATEAAKRAGYSEKTAYSQGHRLLKNAEVQLAIRARISEVAMGADEVLLRLAGHARGSMEQFLTVMTNGKKEKVSLDIVKARDAYALHLVKTFKDSPKDGIEIELYDAQAALVHLGRHHALFTDKIAQTGEGLDLLRQFLGSEDDENEETDGEE